MRKTSKNELSPYQKQYPKVNTSLDEDPITACHSNKTSLNLNNFYQSQQCSSSKKSPGNSIFNGFINNQPTTQSFFKPQFSQGMLVIPDVSKSISQYIQGSKISCQLNQISQGFNKQNRRIQQALFEIRQSTEKKEKQRLLNSLSQSKKSNWTNNFRNSQNIYKNDFMKLTNMSKHSFKADKTFKIDKNIKKRIDFNNQCSKTLKSFKKCRRSPDTSYFKVKKQKNISELIKQQKLILSDMSVKKMIY